MGSDTRREVPDGEQAGLDKNTRVTQFDECSLIPEGLGKSAYQRVENAYLEDLKEQGFVRTERDRFDRRKHRVRVTDEGRQALSCSYP